MTLAIHIQGTGVASTVITGGLTYNPTSAELPKVFEMDGFTFQGTAAHFSANAPGASPITVAEDPR